MAGRQGKLRIGISGWTYKPWRGTFYPKKLPQKNELPYASSVLSSIEINGTFYSLQRPSSFAKWHEQTPDDFLFSLKAPRFITHMKKLREVEAPVANFFLSGVLRLNEKLGPVLWQLPPMMTFNPDVIETFLAELPRTTQAAAELISKTDARMKDRTWSDIDLDRPIRHAMEIRHESFACDEFIGLLRKHHVALVVADTAGKWPMLHDVTADFVYLRLHGADELYASGYTEAGLDGWAKKIQTWSTGGEVLDDRRVADAAPKRATRDVYVYFDNDAKVHSPFDAARLAMKLGLRKEPLERAGEGGEVPRPQWPAVRSTARS